MGTVHRQIASSVSERLAIRLAVLVAIFPFLRKQIWRQQLGGFGSGFGNREFLGEMLSPSFRERSYGVSRGDGGTVLTTARALPESKRLTDPLPASMSSRSGAVKKSRRPDLCVGFGHQNDEPRIDRTLGAPRLINPATPRRDSDSTSFDF